VEELKIDPLDVRDDKFDAEDEYRPEPPAEPIPPHGSMEVCASEFMLPSAEAI